MLNGGEEDEVDGQFGLLTTTTEQAMEHFLEWLERRGVHVSNCGAAPVRIEGTGWGMQATKSFPAGSVIFQIPDSILVTTQTVMASSVGKFFKKYSHLFKPFEALTMWLCCEFLRGEDSEWDPYIQILPQTVTNPVNYEDFPADSLPPSAIPLFTAHRLEFARFFAKLSAVSSELMATDPSWALRLEEERANYSLWDLLCWTWSIVNTRCIFKPGPLQEDLDNCDGDSLALAPFVDLLNHSSHTKIEASYRRSRQCYEVFCHRMVTAGNCSSNLCVIPKLFVEYGFVLQDNPNNALHLSTDDIIRLSKAAGYSVSDKQEEILRMASFPCYLYEASEEPCWGLLSAFKVILMTELEMRTWQERVYNAEDMSDDLSLIKCIKSVLSVFFTELEGRMSDVCFNQVPEKTRGMVRQLWKDELGIVQQAIDQLIQLEEDAES